MRYRTCRFPGTGPLGPREVIVCAHGDAGLRLTREGYVRDGAGARALDSELRGAGVVLRPLFDAPEQLRKASGTRVDGAPCRAPDLSRYYSVVPSGDADFPAAATELNEQLRSHDAIVAAYVQPSMVLTVLPTTVLPSMELPDALPPGPTPDFSGHQGYLGPASQGGIDARFAWEQPGGYGAGGRVVDVEMAWRLDHEDLGLEADDLLGGIPPEDVEARNHGTAVMGMLASRHDRRGVMGICPDADVKGTSIFGRGRRGPIVAIREAADRMSPGDILLIEGMLPGPNRPREGDAQDGYIPIEWWQVCLEAIQYAVSRGVIVVEAAGNGAEDLDDPVYERGSPAFGPEWRNPLRLGGPDSGAILVGAGAPPPGTHDVWGFGTDRSRLPFSNWGGRVDAQGWGLEVTTCGGFASGADALHPTLDESRWYTNHFSGTSSAAPMVAGALACVQGILRAAGRPLLNPAEARDAIRETGVPQASSAGRPASQRIGPRPDLRELIAHVMRGSSSASPVGGAKPPQRRRRSMTITITIEGAGDVHVDNGGGADGLPDDMVLSGWKGPSFTVPTATGQTTVRWEDIDWDTVGRSLIRMLSAGS